jgi:hypothetical protein
MDAVEPEVAGQFVDLLQGVYSGAQHTRWHGSLEFVCFAGTSHTLLWKDQSRVVRENAARGVSGEGRLLIRLLFASQRHDRFVASLAAVREVSQTTAQSLLSFP